MLGIVASPASAGPSIGALSGAGQRPGATRLSFTAGDSVQAQVDVGSGNLLVTVKGLALPDVNRQVQVGAFYNSAAASATPVPRLGRGWGLDYTPDVRLVVNADNSVTYYASGGLTGVFDLVSGSTTTYTSPGGFKSSLVKDASGWTLTEHNSQDALRFNTSGALVSITDRNSNVTTITQSGSATYKNVTITTPAGSGSAKAASVATATSGTTAGTTTITQGASSPRSVSFARPASDATRFTDARGRSTDFTYTSTGLLKEIDAPGAVTTSFTYDSSRRVTSITQIENSTGGPGDSITRLAYPSSTQTLVADPTTNQAQAVSVVPHTTYTLDTTQRVTTAVDAAGRQRSKTYTAMFDTATSTRGTGAGSSTTTNGYTANGGESLTSTTSPTGSSQSLTYATTSGPAQYNPTGSTDDAGNTSTYTYNGAGNQLTSTNAASAQAQVTYNTDGTVASATSPGNGTNATSYGYTLKQPTSMTPVTGSSLGARAYTYDVYGRLKTATNGRGVTTTYTYNLNDQVTGVAYAGAGTLTVSYGYDSAGRNNSRTDASGTTTYAYDQLGRLTSRENTAGGGAVTYTYDKASRLATSTSTGGGTVAYEYDAAGVPTAVEYPTTTGTGKLRFTVDNQGRRTGAYLQADAALTTWAGRTLTTYDGSGRVTRVTADTGPTSANIIDISYCYAAGTAPTTNPGGTPGAACTTSTANDRDKLVWKKDNLTGQTTTYTYDTSGRLTNAAVAGGSGGSGGGSFAYGYDAKSNRTSGTVNGTTQTLTFNAANQITTTGYTYDGAGNLTNDPSSGSSSIAYTPADQTKTLVQGGTTYTYTHAGTDSTELISQTTPDGDYAYTYGRTAPTGVPVVEQVTRTGNTATKTAAVISDPVTGTPLMLRTDTGNQNMYIYDGAPGAPIAAININGQNTFGYNYDPYGVPTITNNPGGSAITQNPYTFAGTGVKDRTTGWVHYAARYYSPVTGTWTQQDTLDAPLDPKNANRYAYAGGDPINNTDPTGQYSLKDFYGDAGACSAGVGLAGASGQITNGIALGGVIGGGPVGGTIGGVATGAAACLAGIGIGRTAGSALLDVVTGS
ncbi:RHS repeat-associated core domain-containing protein [Nocardioides sp. J2M5]|uniref:RHS repeat domain-containing protein n=1 Tax=Nocardioides palaemonis TaxID=2829810 RepID=UPI001BA55802|nr:RHS repeat-associated core domain-containing protein [Nocardioides palaemonis]MBS2938515.1 RHS repeat-associated core domain-containing protein [Nocardioides palaemonis]